MSVRGTSPARNHPATSWAVSAWVRERKRMEGLVRVPEHPAAGLGGALPGKPDLLRLAELVVADPERCLPARRGAVSSRSSKRAFSGSSKRTAAEPSGESWMTRPLPEALGWPRWVTRTSTSVKSSSLDPSGTGTITPLCASRPARWAADAAGSGISRSSALRVTPASSLGAALGAKLRRPHRRGGRARRRFLAASSARPAAERLSSRRGFSRTLTPPTLFAVPGSDHGWQIYDRSADAFVARYEASTSRAGHARDPRLGGEWAPRAA